MHLDKSTIATQEQRREMFHRQIKRGKIYIFLLAVFFILLFGVVGFFILSNNSPQYLFLRISLATISFLMTVCSIFFLLLCNISIQRKETISFILLLAILGVPIVLGVSYLPLFAMLPLSIAVTNQRVLFLHLFFILFTVIWYILIRKSWTANLPINKPLLFRDKPYLRIFYRNLIADGKKSASQNADEGRIGAQAFCILFPEIVTEKAIKKRESLYENGPQASQKGAIFAVMGLILGLAGYWFQLLNPSIRGFILFVAPFIGALVTIHIFLKILVVYQKLRQIEKKEGITFLPYFLKPQKEVDAEVEQENGEKSL